MVIDKSFGKWDDNLDYIDDIAYYLFIKYILSLGTNSDLIMSQASMYFVRHTKGTNIFVDRYYDEAKLILRREKIEKILNRKL